MNTVLQGILASQQVTDGAQLFPLAHPDFPFLPAHIDEAEGELVQAIVRDLAPSVTLEIGLAYGVSTLYLCDALNALPHPALHIAIDPFQSTQWRGIGRRNIETAGFSAIVDIIEERSELVLPTLLDAGVMIDFALIDGWHTFDQVLLEFYYLNRMLRIGGVIAFDDADRRSVNRVIRHALTYPAYAPFPTTRVPSGITAAGHLRRALGVVPGAAQVLRPDFLNRDWDLGILGSCVAIQKIDDDHRTSGWDSTF